MTERIIENEHPPPGEYVTYVVALIISAGKDPQSYDIAGHYDPTLTLNENLQQLTDAYPDLIDACRQASSFTEWRHGDCHYEETSRSSETENKTEAEASHSKGEPYRLILSRTAETTIQASSKLGSPDALEEYINSREERYLYTTTIRKSIPLGGEEDVAAAYIIAGEIALLLTQYRNWLGVNADYYVKDVVPHTHVSKEVRENALFYPMKETVQIVRPPRRPTTRSVSSEERKAWEREIRRLEDAVRYYQQENERLKHEENPAPPLGPHVILGIPETATRNEIKKAYRRLATIYHPDMSRNPESAEIFRLITEAYSKLTGEKPPPPPPTPITEQILAQLAKNTNEMHYCPTENIVTVTTKSAYCVTCHRLKTSKTSRHVKLEKIIRREKATTPYCCTKTGTLIFGDETTHYCEACGEPCQLTHALTLWSSDNDTLTFTLPPQIETPPPQAPRPETRPPPSGNHVSITDQAAKLADGAVQWTKNLADQLDHFVGRPRASTLAVHAVRCLRCGAIQAFTNSRIRYCDKCGTLLRRYGHTQIRSVSSILQGAVCEK